MFQNIKIYRSLEIDDSSKRGFRLSSNNSYININILIFKCTIKCTYIYKHVFF